MPPGSVLPPDSKDDVVKTGYLERYDIVDSKNDGPARIPVLNAQDLEKYTAVIFDVIQVQFNVGTDAYFIPVAYIPEDYKAIIKNKVGVVDGAISDKDKKTRWEDEWSNIHVKLDDSNNLLGKAKIDITTKIDKQIKKK